MTREEVYALRVAAALRQSVGLLLHHVRQVPVDGELTLPERAALARLRTGGPSTASAMAKLEQISPQSMGATLNGLEARGLIGRSPDPDDGRRAVLSIAAAGVAALEDRRTVRNQQMATVLADTFTRAELEQLLAATPLIERLAQAL